jgi:hypothetical protein
MSAYLFRAIYQVSALKTTLSFEMRTILADGLQQCLSTTSIGLLVGLGGVLATLTLAFVVLTGSTMMLTRRMRRIRMNTKIFGQLTRDTNSSVPAFHGAEARANLK